ncbi:MAG: ATP-binding protein [Anaerolineales bacterium]|nr:ATP-binding protein [Anaerolineales bacterium]
MKESVSLEFPAHHKFLSVLGAAVAAFADLTGDANLAYSVQLAIHEVCANTIDHAYVAPHPDNRVVVHLTANDRALHAEIIDRGQTFDPQSFSWPLATTWEKAGSGSQPVYHLRRVAEPDLDQERGRGMFMICQLMDEVTFTPQPNQNVWRLTRRYTPA